MRITYLEKPEDPVYPVMHGKTPLAKEFNKRQKTLYKEGGLGEVDYKQITTVLLEILVDDYNKRNTPIPSKTIVKVPKIPQP